MNYRINRRIILTFLIFTICFLALIIRMSFISFSMKDFISKRAYEQWTREIPINSGRGKIYDRNDRLIVGNKKSLTLVSINRQVKDKEYVANTISGILGQPKDKILKHLNKNVSVEIIKPEARHISVNDAKKIMNLNIDGLYLATDSKRYYPYIDSLGQTLGFTNIDNEGLTGLEFLYDKYLKEGDGALKIYTDAKGNLMDNMVSYYQNSTNGMDVHLTIDMEITSILDSIVKNVALKYDPSSVICGVMDVNTGEVLGISQYPFYEIENYKNYDQEIYNRNFLVWKSFEPGSTFKIVTYSAGLEENVFDFNDTVNCSGVRDVSSSKIHCWKRQGHGSETMLEVIENSCNVGFMEIGKRLGVNKLMNYIKSYGFGRKTDIDILGESKGILFDEKSMGPVELATSSFGQGNSATPIQLMTMMSCAINGGKLLKPYVLNYVKDSLGNLVYENKRTVVKEVISKSTSDKMRHSLESVCANGTGRNAYVNGYRVGGKTGTAQTVLENGKYSSSNYILSFLGAAPMNNPKVCAYIAIEGAKNTVQYGGVVAAPIIGEVLEQILPYLNVKKDNINQMEKKYRFYIDEKYYTVKNYIGIMKEAIPKNYNYNILFIGDGKKVIDQTPEPNEKIKEGGTIVLYLG